MGAVGHSVEELLSGVVGTGSVGAVDGHSAVVVSIGTVVCPMVVVGVTVDTTGVVVGVTVDTTGGAWPGISFQGRIRMSQPSAWSNLTTSGAPT